MSGVKESGDPRLQALFGIPEAKEIGVRPVVRLPRSGPSGLVLAVVAVFAAVILFWVLESRRNPPAEPSVRMRAADMAQGFTEAPPLYIPPVAAPLVPIPPNTQPVAMPQTMGAARQSFPSPAPAPQIIYAPQPFENMASQPAPPPPRSNGAPALVVDTTSGAASTVGNQSAPSGGDSTSLASAGRASGTRMRASALANRSNTVPQGVLIPAVLETAFDSTRPGFARAIVSRDVRGFDGSKILIPRGSRLIGEYGSDAAPGQNRALINWTRLIRPDGMTISIDSPAVDPLGRGGVAARVDTHFFERFAGAVLQSTIDLGRTLAGNAVTGPVVVAMPGSVQNTGGSSGFGAAIMPTLKVAAGKSISVFVAHDLDFGTPENGR